MIQVDADKDIVIQRKDSHHSHSKKVSVPQPMDALNNKPSESLPVYTQKQWIADKDEVPDENMKTSPSIADIKMPSK